MPRPTGSNSSPNRKIREFLKEQTPLQMAAATRARSPSNEAMEIVSPIKDRAELYEKVRELGFNEKTRKMHKAWSRRELFSSEEGIEIFVATPGFDDSACRYLTENNPFKGNNQEIF